MTYFISYDEAVSEIEWYLDITNGRGQIVLVENTMGDGYELLEKRVVIDDTAYGGDNTFIGREDATRLSKERGIEIIDFED